MIPLRILGLLVLLAPGAAAEFVVESVTAPTQPLQPLTDIGNVTITFAADCSDLQDAVASSAVNGDPVLSTTFETPPAVGLAGSLTKLFPLAPCRQDPTESVRVTLDQNVFLQREARAYRPYEISFTGTLPASALRATLVASGNFSVTAGYVGRLELRAVEKLVQAHGSQATVQFEITNFGNGACQPKVQLVTGPNSTTQLVFPSLSSLSAAGDTGDHATFFVNATGMRSGNYQEAWTVQVTCASTEGPGDTQPLQATFLVRQLSAGSKGTPAPIALPLAALGIALASRRRA